MGIVIWNWSHTLCYLIDRYILSPYRTGRMFQNMFGVIMLNGIGNCQTKRTYLSSNAYSVTRIKCQCKRVKEIVNPKEFTNLSTQKGLVMYQPKRSSMLSIQIVYNTHSLNMCNIYVHIDNNPLNKVTVSRYLGTFTNSNIKCGGHINSDT